MSSILFFHLLKSIDEARLGMVKIGLSWRDLQVGAVIVGRDVSSIAAPSHYHSIHIKATIC
jgi:hypothetical protein